MPELELVDMYCAGCHSWAATKDQEHVPLLVVVEASENVLRHNRRLSRVSGSVGAVEDDVCVGKVRKELFEEAYEQVLEISILCIKEDALNSDVGAAQLVFLVLQL
ncbi:hypothetical protein NDU88_000112 [Pleurodeles waltl]|uniref:Uncharacterized protein n=1 Tax=Pleurodeles waltl TaxID=8319 RepID=A0AAV7TFC5_PLEWA|nr:hypothetical protein NDU88_000112 [Pleurodeles waltl]